jgi:hypothetical protein
MFLSLFSDLISLLLLELRPLFNKMSQLSAKAALQGPQVHGDLSPYILAVSRLLMSLASRRVKRQFHSGGGHLKLAWRNDKHTRWSFFPFSPNKPPI